MELKKSPKANLEKNRVVLIQIGLVIVLACVLLAFEWKSFDKTDFYPDNILPEEGLEEIVMNTQQKPPPPPPKQQTFELNIVEDDIEIEDDFEIDSEVDETTEIEEYIAPEIDEDPIGESTIFLVVEHQPEFPGGEAGRKKFLQDNMKYPRIALESGIEGTVYINFVVEPDGSISNLVMRRGIGGGCDEEALRVVKLMPKWIPGKQRGKAVRVNFNMPLKFILER